MQTYEESTPHDSMIVQRMSTQNTPTRPTGKPPLAQYGKDITEKCAESSEPTEAEICPNCMTYGHTAEECTKTGAAITINQFLKTCPPEKKRIILDAYRKNRKEAHEQYLCAYKKRCQLKQQIRCLEYDHQFDTNTKEWKKLDGPASQALDDLRISCVITAKKETPNLDFGSLDDNYDDLLEPQLNFDPQVDKIPETDHA